MLYAGAYTYKEDLMNSYSLLVYCVKPHAATKQFCMPTVYHI